MKCVSISAEKEDISKRDVEIGNISKIVIENEEGSDGGRCQQFGNGKKRVWK
jgi:hypothetical protein